MSPSFVRAEPGLVMQRLVVQSQLEKVVYLDSHKNHKAFVRMAKRLEQMSGHNECCSVPTSCSIPA